MKLVNILITEGRKEDLEKKYSKSYGQPQLDYILNDPFIKKTNYKYGDFLLKNLSYPAKSEIMDAISLLKKFDKLSKNLIYRLNFPITNPRINQKKLMRLKLKKFMRTQTF